MDDLAGLDWSKNSGSQKTTAANYNLNPSFTNLRPTPPVSGRATPQPSASTAAAPQSKPATPVPSGDSFANLVSWSNNPSQSNLSLQEQQKRLAEAKSQQQKTGQTVSSDRWAGADDAAWDTLGSGRSTPALVAQRNGKGKAARRKEEADGDGLFASLDTQSKPTVKAVGTQPLQSETAQDYPEDDDPFGLSEFSQKEVRRKDTAATIQDDDDDVLGLLGKPVDISRRRADEEEPPRPKSKPQSIGHPQDRAIADLVDMGFSADQARAALDTTESGTDVQAAVSYLLNSAHQEARERSQSRNQATNGHMNDVPQRERGGQPRPPGRQRAHVEDDQGPVMQRRQQSSPAEKDPAQVAADFSASFFKTANSLWKQGQKKVQQAVQEFNSDSETGGGQPKWMRDAGRQDDTQHQDNAPLPSRRRQASPPTKKQQDNVTDEAMMLESQRPTPPPRQAPRRVDPRLDSSADTSRDHSPAVPSRLRETSSPQPAFVRQQQAKAPPQPSRTALSRQANEEQAAQAYVSTARRRKPQQPVQAASEPDLFDTSSKQTPPPRPQSSRPAQSAPKPSPTPSRPPPPARNIPSIPPINLKASHTAREAGNAHFKRGDYSSAHESYSTSLKQLPASHPLTLVLLTNRALTALKIGEPKTALADSDVAITLIGVSKGESETLDFLDNSPPKPMRDYYGKALMRKAEALEQMEKWELAASVWREAVEGGHGGATSMQGRLRAEKAAAPKPAAPVRKPATTAAAARRPPVKPKPASSGNSTAVTALRAANAAADQADDERFMLSDSVDARIKGWKDGKQDNLRALLGSLDTVLWPEANWKKIGMADLVLPTKVKIQYMKGIAKVHPDKIPPDATTEQRMISGSVFSALNEAWDKFKAENGL